MSSQLIRAHDLTRVYRQGSVDIHALRGVDIELSRGEFTVLSGPSGSGKSTLLNLMGCLDRPTQGQLLIAGTDSRELSRAAAALFRLQHIGFVFQAYNLLPVLTAFENAEYTLMLQNVPTKDRRDRVMGLLERVGLADMAGRKPHELSGGQQQRVAVVRAIATDPELVLADEPTANLDSEASGALMDIMGELNESNGTTFVFATHDRDVMSRARRIVHLRDGCIAEDDNGR